MGTKNKILDADQILKKINRLAFEIYENNFQETEIGIVGVAAAVANAVYDATGRRPRTLPIRLDTLDQ